MRRLKNILLISPQPWSALHISKHHYALALAKAGHEVYYLNPAASWPAPVNISQPFAGLSLFVVDSGFFKSLFLRYKLGFAYDWFVKRWINKVMKALPPIDLAWCFDTNTIRDLSVLGLMKKIFHVVDPVDIRMLPAAAQADLVVCVSDRILLQFRQVNTAKLFVNHGLSDTAITLAKEIRIGDYRPNGKKKIGYVGNLFRQVMDPALVAKIVAENPEAAFHFFGPYVSADSALGGEGPSLADHLARSPNVTFHGPVPSEDVVRHLSDMDVLLLAYRSLPGFYDSSNSHKILEYLATGRVVVSTYIDQYARPEFSGMLAMTPEDRPEDLPLLFKSVINELVDWNAAPVMEKRRNYALEHSYRNHVKKILGAIG